MSVRKIIILATLLVAVIIYALIQTNRSTTTNKGKEKQQEQNSYTRLSDVNKRHNAYNPKQGGEDLRTSGEEKVASYTCPFCGDSRDEKILSAEGINYPFKSHDELQKYYASINATDSEEERLKKLIYRRIVNWPTCPLRQIGDIKQYLKQRGEDIFKFKEKGVKILMDVIKNGPLYPETGSWHSTRALFLLSKPRYRESVDPLELYKIVKERDDTTRQTFAMLLENWVGRQNQECLKDITKLLEDKCLYVRASAAASLGEIGSHAAISYLEKAKSSSKNKDILDLINTAMTQIYINNMPREQKFKKLRDIALGIDVLSGQDTRCWAIEKIVEERYEEAKDLIRYILDNNNRYRIRYDLLIYGLYELGGELSEDEKDIIRLYYEVE